MGLRAQDKSELCGGKSPEAQAGSKGVGGPSLPVTSDLEAGPVGAR